MIEVKKIAKDFGTKKVLKEISFTAEKGKITCLIGLNGAGKTTILNAIMNLTPIKKGEILIDGKPLRTETYKEIIYIPDTISMNNSYTIKEAFAFMADFYSNWNEERAGELLAFFKLNLTDKLNQLSKGNKAKVNLMLGLAVDAKYILMDEPFSGIDIFSREQIAEVFVSHLIENRGVIITTHEIQDIEHLVDEVVLLEDGYVHMQFDVEKRREEGQSITDVMREVYQQ